MSEVKKRKIFFRTNRYQRTIILLVLYPCLVYCTVLTLFILYFHRELIDMVLYASVAPSVRVIHQWGGYMVVLTWTFFFISLLWAIAVSNHLVGAFERIIRELDEMIRGRDIHPIRVRPGDQLAQDLVKRLNVIIENLPDASAGPDPREIGGRF